MEVVPVVLHRCPECNVLYLVSDYTHMCNVCGRYLQQRIERLHEVDTAESWIVLMSRAVHGEQPRREARWRIG